MEIPSRDILQEIGRILRTMCDHNEVALYLPIRITILHLRTLIFELHGEIPAFNFHIFNRSNLKNGLYKRIETNIRNYIKENP